MSRLIQRKAASLKEKVAKKTKIEGWILPKQESSWAPAGSWSNIDLDITPLNRRSWNSITILGYWISDVISVQSWETGSSILAVGLTWREAVFGIVFGSFVMAVPMSLNGYIGAATHAPFPVLARASFGYYLSKFPVIVRLVTCLFWHAITNYLGVPAAVQIIRAIWPQFRNVPNHIPDHVGITTQEMIAYFLFWLVQFPLLLIPPHKLRLLFLLKVVMMIGTVVGMTIWICLQAGGSGNIWQQQAAVSGSTKSWLIMWTLNSCTTSWATVGVNIPDFTRYMKSPRSSLSQGIWFPLICSWIAIMGIVVTSASAVLYGAYIWDPIDIVDTWEGPGGRAAAFFAGVSWCLAQMCVNMSATVVSGANDLTSLFPKWINIRRGTILLAFVGGWAMVPWKIMKSDNSLLSFFNSLGIFLAPIMGIQVSDFFIVKRQALDIPELYNPRGRYRYWYGINWRALAALIVAITPLLPGLINAVNPSIYIGHAKYLANFNWYFGFFVCGGVYSGLSICFPAHESLVSHLIETREAAAEYNPDAEKQKELQISSYEI